MSTYDVIIVGGGAMGSATAYYLGLIDPSLTVAVIEKDPTYEFSSTLRSEGNLRIQFNLEENIRMSQFAMSLMETFPDDFEVDGWRPDPAPRRQGNLFLVDEATVDAAKTGLELQLSLGCAVEWLDAREIARRWPDLVTTGVVGATFGSADGMIDPSAVLHALRRNAVKLGAEYRTAEA
ncbi:MAG: FAD-dependent oxidoreductase, partial [Acidimicrobiia bacterium]|nr:FAD-dependent oxidoreductase [Acidimicrobiia bacterium]